MYSERVILRNLEDFEQREGWMPVYHSIEQVDEFKAYIDAIVHVDTNSKNSYISLSARLTKRREDEIRRWIENEQVLCCLDSSYWETRYAYFCNEQADIYRFKNRKSQEVFDAIIAGFEEDQVSIELLILKARQQGISTKVAMKFLHRLMFLPQTRAVMASADADKSKLLELMLRVCFERQPWWLSPKKTSDNSGGWGFNNGAILSIQSGKQATGIAQGWTPTCVHISELADIPNPRKVIEEGLLRATHSSRKLFMVFEGTGGGSTGWLADKWRAAKEGWPKGVSRLCPMFIPWPLAPDLYPEADWVRKFPVPEGWNPGEATRKHVRKCELFVRNTPYLARICGPHWKMPREQQWFWEFNYLEAVKTRTERVWFSQMPADDLEALTGKNDSVFSEELIEVVTQDRERIYDSYAVTGDSIDDGFDPDPAEIDYERPRIRVKWVSHRGQKYEWVMVPLKPFDETKERNALTKVLIFEHPRQGYEYSMGIDTADGLGKDDEERSCLSITHSVMDAGCDRQVAELTSNRINPPQMVGFAACLAAYYGSYAGDPRGVKLAIEQRARPGDDCQLQLKLMGFNWHHNFITYDGKKVRETASHKEGWYSNAWSVPLLMNRFVEAVNGGWYKPNSPYLIEELKTLERKAMAGKSKMEHQSGKYDDRVRAASMSYFTRHALEILADRAQKRYALPREKAPELNRAACTVAEVSIGDW